MTVKVNLTLAGLAGNLEEKRERDNLKIGTFLGMVFELPTPMQQPRITAIKIQDMGTSFRAILTGVDGRKPVIAFVASGTMVKLMNKIFEAMVVDELKWRLDEWALERLDKSG